MLRRIAAGAAVAALATVVVVATPASAAPYNCATSHVCLWTDANYDGTRQQISGFADYTDLNGHLHDRASSWGSSNNSQRMCVINWINGGYQNIGVLSPGNRTAYVGDASNDKADAVQQC